MESKDILVIVLVITVFGISIYRKYMKKNKPGQYKQKPGHTGSSFSSVRDDDYEPYSKK
jgi:hypothetical protein